MKKQLLTGNEIVVKAALAAGATAYFGYPITPATEIMTEWDKEYENNKKKLIFLQTEDEMSAGFAMIGSVLTGLKAFTATAGPGNILMQDAFAMAEAMRIPTVAVIGQRGGPSTGSVIYSQQEVTLTAFGGNGEGYRTVYSPASLQDLYDQTIKAFNMAWKYKFPTFVLTDGYTLKTRALVELKKPNNLIKSHPLVLKSKTRDTSKESNYENLNNTFTTEEQCFQVNTDLLNAFNKMKKEVAESETYSLTKSAQTLVIAHGIVSASVQQAINDSQNKKVKLFRPITIHPFPDQALKKKLKGIKKIIVIESAANQLLKITKEALYGNKIPIENYSRPGLGISPEEIIKLIK
jgi:2-oxoglutarate/2-oxoacid ferredoxin oxidoreductase subunit alpha